MWKLTRKDIGLTAALALFVMAPTVAAQLHAQNASAKFPDLVGALRSTPGCIGVDVARTASGKQVIFAWFEDKKAVLNWYYSSAHEAAMHQFFPAAGAAGKRTPLADVPDDSGPILAIASITLADKPDGAVTTLPVSQIAIELYRPLPGGLALGGRFAPDGVRVPGMRIAPLAAPPSERR